MKSPFELNNEFLEACFCCNKKNIHKILSPDAIIKIKGHSYNEKDFLLHIEYLKGVIFTIEFLQVQYNQINNQHHDSFVTSIFSYDYSYHKPIGRFNIGTIWEPIKNHSVLKEAIIVDYLEKTGLTNRRSSSGL